MVSCGFANICGGVLNSPQCEQPVFLQAGAPAPPYLCRFRPVGKGLERETLLPFPRLRRFGTHSETGSKFLLLFSIKSKEESPCFAETVLNWRSTDVAQAKLLRDCAIFSLARMRPFKLPSSSTLSAFSANPPTAPSPAPHPPAAQPQADA